MFTILSSETVGQYRIDETSDRFGDPMWFVLDLSAPDWTCLPAIIRQAPTRAQAVAGLPITPHTMSVEHVLVQYLRCHDVEIAHRWALAIEALAAHDGLTAAQSWPTLAHVEARQSRLDGDESGLMAAPDDSHALSTYYAESAALRKAADYGDLAGWFAQPRDGVAADPDVAASWARLATHYARVAVRQ